jgi:isopenicillin-N epimerase
MPAIAPNWPTTAAEESEWDAVGKLFLNDPDQIYLNTGSWGVLARPVYDAMIAAIREQELNPTASRDGLLEGVEEARRRLAGLVNACPEDLAFLTNVTVAVNTVVNGLDWRDGDEILASDQEYGAIDNCLHNASRRWGVTLRRAAIPIPPKSPWDVVKAFEAAITDRTRLVLCSHVTTGTGLIAPVKALADLAHARGALIVIDGAHAPGMIPLDLRAYGCDFYGGNCHKWLCSPKGVGFLHAAPEVQERMKHLVVSWGYSKSGTTRDCGGRPLINGKPYMWGIEQWGTVSLPEQVATGEAVRFQTNIGLERIAQRGRQLAGYLRRRMSEFDWAELLSPTHPEMTGSISTFRLSGWGEMKLRETLLQRHRITVPAWREGPHQVLRVSTHIYNSFSQVDRLVEALRLLRGGAWQSQPPGS